MSSPVTPKDRKRAKTAARNRAYRARERIEATDERNRAVTIPAKPERPASTSRRRKARAPKPIDTPATATTNTGKPRSGGADGRIMAAVLGAMDAQGRPPEVIVFDRETQRPMSRDEWLQAERKAPHELATVIIAMSRPSYDPLDTADVSRVIRAIQDEPEIAGLDPNYVRATLAHVEPGKVARLVVETPEEDDAPEYEPSLGEAQAAPMFSADDLAPTEATP